MIIGSLIHKSGSIRNLAAMCLLTIAAASPSIAQVTFASYGETDSSVQQWAIFTSGLTTTVTASGSVQFEFGSSITGLPFSGFQTATFNLSATSNSIGNCGGIVVPTCANGDSYGQPGYSGIFSIIDTSLPTGFQNLLSGTFAVTGSSATTGAQFSSNIGSSGGSFNASSTDTNLLQLVLTSSYLNFSGLTEDASFSLSSLDPAFAIGSVSNGTQAYPASGTFTASGTGTFSSDTPPALTPEPATLALIGVGLFGLGVVRRGKPARP